MRASVFAAIGFLFLLPRQVHARDLSLSEVIAHALEANLELKALNAEVNAASARLTGARLPLQANPEISGEVAQRREPGGAKIPQYRIEVAQPLEIAGQRGARISAADAGLASAQAHLRARQVELVAEVRTAFTRVLTRQSLLRVATDAESIAREALSAAEERFRAGSASRMEVNTARVEVGRAAREHSLAAQQVGEANSELILLARLGPETPTLLGSVSREAPELPPVEQLVALAERQRADALAATSEAEAAQAERRLAGKEAVPNIRVGAAYAYEENAHIIGGTLGIALPLFNRNQAARGITSARAQQANLALESLRRRIDQEVRQAALRYQLARTAAQAYAADVVKAMEENLGLAAEAYRAGKIDFLQLTLIRRETLEGRRGYVLALEDLATAEAQLDRVVGRTP